ncbi:TPA: hypothetical protein ACH3X1_007635 [Trebouxia sp. C0004]
MVSPDVMQDIDNLIDAAEKVGANLDMSTKQAKEQPRNDRLRGLGRVQANYVDRNRGDNRYRPAPYHTQGRGRGAAVNAVRALPPQEVQFNAAQSYDEHHPANNWAPHDVCNNCHQASHKWQECPRLAQQYMPAPQAAGGPGRGRGRGRGMAGVSIYSSVFGAPTGRVIDQRFGEFGYGCVPTANDHECEHAQHDSDLDSDTDGYDYVGNKRYKVISGKSLRHSFEMTACNALSRNGLRMMFTVHLQRHHRNSSLVIMTLKC